MVKSDDRSFISIYQLKNSNILDLKFTSAYLQQTLWLSFSNQFSESAVEIKIDCLRSEVYNRLKSGFFRINRVYMAIFAPFLTAFLLFRLKMSGQHYDKEKQLQNDEDDRNFELDPKLSSTDIAKGDELSSLNQSRFNAETLLEESHTLLL